jgi:hypothetical protein
LADAYEPPLSAVEKQEYLRGWTRISGPAQPNRLSEGWRPGGMGICFIQIRI